MTVEETGLSEPFITDLLLKTLYVHGARTGQQLVDTVRLPFDFVDQRLLDMQQRMLAEVRGTTGHSRAGYVFDLTNAGRERAQGALETSQYVGPAPVPLAQYGLWTMRQSIQHVKVTRDQVVAGFKQMVLDPKVFEIVGPAINSARSLFLYGGPGNGKTFISETIASMLGVRARKPCAARSKVMKSSSPSGGSKPASRKARNSKRRLRRRLSRSSSNACASGKRPSRRFSVRSRSSHQARNVGRSWLPITATASGG